MRILVVEDEAIIARDLRELLESRGCDVAAPAVSAEESLDRAEILRPDLVFMDVRVQGALSGSEAARLIQARYRIPVVCLTAYGDEPFFLSRAANGPPHIYKPFGEGEIGSLLAALPIRHIV